MIEFPSIEWFEGVRRVFNTEDCFQSPERCDATIGIKIKNAVFVLRFEGFECSSAKLGSEEKLEKVDFSLEMTLHTWQKMITNIKQNGGADTNQSLDTLDVSLSPSGIVRTNANSKENADLFFLHNQTFQNFFNASSRIDTSF